MVGEALLTEHGGQVSIGERWCRSCGQTHDALHACPSYPAELLSEIAAHQAMLDAVRADPEVAMHKGGLRQAEALLRKLWAGAYG